MKRQVSVVEPIEPARTKAAQNPPNHSSMRQRVNHLHARRKWSDWSECSAECIKTRHRLNCDDIIQAGENQLQSESTPKVANNVKQLAAKETQSLPRTILSQVDGLVGRQVQINERRLLNERHSPVSHRSNDNEDEDELVYKADQADDDDYADEGDEEEETDSCSNVDTSKTFEQSACLGGLCRLPLLGATNPILSGSAINLDTNTRPRSNDGGSSQRKQRRKQQQQLKPTTGIHSEGKLNFLISVTIYHLQQLLFSTSRKCYDWIGSKLFGQVQIKRIPPIYKRLL